MKRYYLCPVVGTGGSHDPYRAKVSDYGVNHVAVIPTYPDGDPNAGNPIFSWCLAIVDAVNHAQIIADPAIDAAPDATLDTKWGAVGQAVRTLFRNRLQSKYGFTLAELGNLDNSDGYRDALNGIGQKLDSNFDVNNFDVSPSGA